MGTTSFFGWTFPVEFGSPDIWGGILNTLFNAQDSTVRQSSPTGMLCAFDLAAAPSGWVAHDGKTVGNASSNATGRANADAQALFTAMWAFNNTLRPIYDSAGIASTRGASAAADFAANKAIALGDSRDRVLRAYKSGGLGPALGDVQADAMQRITGIVGLVGPSSFGGSYPTSGAFSTTGSAPDLHTGNDTGTNLLIEADFNSANSTTPNAAKTNDTETRVASYGALVCIRL